MSKHAYDYVIVGLGTAGSPLAKLLTDDLETSVFAIEGGDDRREDPVVLAGVDLAAEGFVTDFVPNLHWFFMVQLGSFPDHILINSFYPYTEGRMWGGSSGHNYFVAVRGAPETYESWAQGTQCPRWRYDRLLPAMIYLEHYTPNGTVPNPQERGADGPLFITQAPTDAAGSFYSALATVGSPYVPDYNDPSTGDTVSSATQTYTTPENVRSWAASAFLGPDVVDACGEGVCGRKLKIASHAVATKILVECKHGKLRAVGVRYVQEPADARNCESGEERVIDVYAREKVILCAGTIADAVLLQNSGIGPREVLEPLGVEVLIDNPNVGRNVQNHYGPPTFIPTDPANPIGDPATGAGVQAFVDLDGFPTGRREFQLLVSSTGFIIPFNLRPARNGTIEITSADPTVSALTQLRFYEDPTDVAKTVAVLKVIADVSLAYTGSMPFFPDASLYPVTYPGGTFPDDSGLESFVLDPDTPVVPANHNSGSARMADSPERGVVDGNLDVFGIEGLSVADNAVVPEILTGNTAYSAYVVGLTKAKIEIERRGGCAPF